jgi:hypothetical protein
MRAQRSFSGRLSSKSKKRKHLRRVQSNQVIYGVTELLFAAQVFFSSLHTDMPQQKLNLFQFTAGKMS